MRDKNINRKEQPMAKFMLIINQEPGFWQQMSPEALQRKVQEYRTWTAKFHANGRHVSGEKLADEGGKVLKLQNGRPLIVDGPYMEAKEVVAGYFLFRAANYEEAIELIRDCPMLKDGTIMLR